MANLRLPTVLPLLTIAAMVACSPSSPVHQPSSDPIPLTESTSTGAPPTAPPTHSSAAPAASSSEAVKAAELPSKPASSGPPMVVSENEKEVTAAYSVSGGIIRIAESAELILSRGSLSEMHGFTFGLNTGKTMLKITPYKGQLGDIYRIFIFLESASTQPVNLTTAGPPFILKLPIKGAKTANLVIATAENGKAKYSIFAPKSVLTSDTGNTAVFELNNLPGEGILHLTSAPPTP